ncbi:MAG: 13E12 repeat family protein, partial [Actinomycetota bacterium]|nr:13E12 repeat family protein [Actinomycetota bacterium]
VVPEILDVSEWLPHELQMAHPYSLYAAKDLVDTSQVLTGRLAATLELLAAGRIDYRRACVLADLLGDCAAEVAGIVQAMVLPRAPELTPGGLASAVRRALARIDAAALRRRHARARKSADVGYYTTADGMARIFADLPLPVAAACVDAVGAYAASQRHDGDIRPIGMIRTEILTELILKSWDTSRPAVTAEVTVHLTIPTGAGGSGAGLDEEAVEADVNGQVISAAQCRELLSQLEGSRLFLALHQDNGQFTAVATPARLRRAARRKGLRPPPDTPGYRPTRAQDRHVRTRDRHCRHFGCTRKAVHADLDHHHRWPAGKTGVCNLCTYCRTHHRLKHQAPAWTRHLQADATLRITTPTGITRTTRPPGTEWPLTPEDLLPALSAPAATEPPRPAIPQPDDDPPPF